MRKYTRLVLFWKRVKEAILSELEATTLAADNDVRAQPAAHQTRPYLLDTLCGSAARPQPPPCLVFILL